VGRAPEPYSEGPTDEELARHAQAGDEAAARILFDRHVGRLRARVRRRIPALLQGKVAASDVIQETYLAAFLGLGDFEDRGQGSFGRWLGKILENKVRDQLRRHLGTEKRSARRERKDPSTTTIGGVAAEGGPTPSAVVMAREARQGVHRTIDRLAPGHREILRLVHGEGLRLSEAAKRLGKSEDAVRKAYSRAVSAFTERMTREQREP
jgi:RNA polymerase sigma-70 factor (ECF subfamily)